MSEASRLNTTARALGQALEGLADALAEVRPEAIAASEASIEACVRDFQAASAAAPASGEVLAPASALLVRTALARCRRLGASLLLLAGPRTPPPDSPRGYTPVGQPLPVSGEGSILTARG